MSIVCRHKVGSRIQSFELRCSPKAQTYLLILSTAIKKYFNKRAAAYAYRIKMTDATSDMALAGLNDEQSKERLLDVETFLARAEEDTERRSQRRSRRFMGSLVVLAMFCLLAVLAPFDSGVAPASSTLATVGDMAAVTSLSAVPDMPAKKESEGPEGEEKKPAAAAAAKTSAKKAPSCGKGTERFADVEIPITGGKWPCWAQKYFAWKYDFEEGVYNSLGFSHKSLDKFTKKFR